MKRLLFLIVLFLSVMISSQAKASLFLSWGQVTLGTDGNVLVDPVSKYTVYRCDLSVPVCNKTTGIKIGEVSAPFVSLDITTQPVPSYYFVTATNIVAESKESILRKTVAPTTVQGVNTQTQP